MKVVVCLVVLTITLVSCQHEVKSEMQVRTIIESFKNGDATLSVYLEGPDGNTVDGAMIVVKDSSNSVFTISFDPQFYCYYATTPVPADGWFHITVHSVLLDSPLVYEILHKQAPTAPIVTEFRDSSGNSALSGQVLSRDSNLQLAWEPLLDGAVYRVTISDSFGVLYSDSTTSSVIILPPIPLDGASWLNYQVIAQLIHGDPFFKTTNYYSVSTYPGAYLRANFE